MRISPPEYPGFALRQSLGARRQLSVLFVGKAFSGHANLHLARAPPRNFNLATPATLAMRVRRLSFDINHASCPYPARSRGLSGSGDTDEVQ